MNDKRKFCNFIFIFLLKKQKSQLFIIVLNIHDILQDADEFIFYIA